MKLYYGPNSPYARKCRIIIIEKGLEKKVELISVDAGKNPPELLKATPLGTVPALITDEGLHLCESPIICEYLDSLGGEPSLFPSKGPARFPVMALATLSDGIMDAAVTCVLESRRPEGNRYPAWIERKEAAVVRTLDLLAKHAVADEDSLTIGTIALGCALGYVGFRLPHLQWQKGRDQLAKWYETLASRPSFKATAPAA